MWLGWVVFDATCEAPRVAAATKPSSPRMHPRQSQAHPSGPSGRGPMETATVIWVRGEYRQVAVLCSLLGLLHEMIEIVLLGTSYASCEKKPAEPGLR